MTCMLIRNGRLVDPSQSLDAGMDLLIEDGHIARLGERIEAPTGAEVIDASELAVAPGFIDLHAHLREPGEEQKETIATGARAAAAGGFTAVCAMANTVPVNDDPSVTRFIIEKGQEAGAARVHPIGALTRGRRGEALAEIGEMAREGALAFSDAPLALTNSLLMRRALEYCRSFDVPVFVHPEDLALSDGGSMHEGAISTSIGLKGMPAAAEEIMVARDLILAAATSGRLHITHVSTQASVELIRRAKADGQRVTCEVTPHHLSLIDEDVASANYDPRWKMNPPLRSREDREAILQGLYDGSIDAIVSDHAPHHRDENEMDFADAPFGVSSLETAVSVAIDRLYHPKVLGISQLIRLFSTSPAEILSLEGAGTLREGSVADVTLLDLGRRWKVDSRQFVSRGKNTPFEGVSLRGRPAMTIVGGKIVWRV